MTGTIRILIADDHPVVRDGLTAMLATQDDFQVVGEAADGAEAVALVGRHEPDIVLMDLRMPELDGVSATARILERPGAPRVLVLTTYDTDADIVRALDVGATGYLLKDAPREDLFRAIRGAARGEAMLSPAVARRVMDKMRGPAEEMLTAREIEVLDLVARGKANKEIARDLYLSEATVKTHLLHIFAKLGVDDRTAAATVAMERGVLRRPGDR